MSTNFKDKEDYAQFLHDASEFKVEKDGFTLSVLKPGSEIPVIEVFLK